MKHVKCPKEVKNMDKRRENTPKVKKIIEVVDLTKSQDVVERKGSVYDLSTLYGERHISDDVINCFSKLLMRKDRKALITNTQFFEQLEKKKWTGISHWKMFGGSRRLSKEWIREVKWLMIPVNRPGHWILLAYNHR